MRRSEPSLLPLPLRAEDPNMNNPVELHQRLTLLVSEAALLTGMQREVLDAAIRAGQLRTMNLPGHKRTTRAELDRWLDAITRG